MFSFFVDAGRIVRGAIAAASVLLSIAIAPCVHAERNAGSLATEIARLEELLDSYAGSRSGPDSTQKADRDRLLLLAREAAGLAHAIDALEPAALEPDSLSIRSFSISIAAYAEALTREALLLDRGAGAGFRPIWNEAVNHELGYLGRWSSLWRRPVAVPGEFLYIPLHLLSLCLPETFAGDGYSLPRDQWIPRMAVLPDSIAACCMDESACRAASGAGCREYVAGLVARAGDLDAMAGFRYGRLYWSLPQGIPPRSRVGDRLVASSTIQAVDRILRAAETAQLDAPFPRTASGAVPSDAALAALRSSGELWPPMLDPFRTVPGLRNPRYGESGSLIVELALYRACLDAAGEETASWLRQRLGERTRLLLVDP